MILHGLAIVLCFVGLVVLSLLGEPGALRQLVYFVVCVIVALLMGAGMLSLFFG